MKKRICIICMVLQAALAFGCADTDKSAPESKTPAEQDCTAGSRKCSEDGTAAYVCGSNGWQLDTACPNGCFKGACVSSEPVSGDNQCESGARECSEDGARAYVCSGGSWLLGDMCTAGCADGVCKKGEAASCTENSIKCSDDGGAVLTCKSGVWKQTDVCDHGCGANGCITSAPVCVNGTKKCSDDGKTTYQCSDGQWLETGSCDNGCSNGECKTVTVQCTDGSAKCGDDGVSVISCVSGVWVKTDTCADGCSNGRCTDVPAQCTNGSTKCGDDGLSVLSCNLGVWVEADACSNGCSNGKCIEPVVFPEAGSDCDSNMKELCDGTRIAYCNKNDKVVVKECDEGCALADLSALFSSEYTGAFCRNAAVDSKCTAPNTGITYCTTLSGVYSYQSAYYCAKATDNTLIGVDLDLYGQYKDCSGTCNADETACEAVTTSGASTHTLGASCTEEEEDARGCDGNTLVYCDGKNWVNALSGDYTCDAFGAGYYCDEQADYFYADCVKTCDEDKEGTFVAYDPTLCNSDGVFELMKCELGDSGKFGTFGGYYAESMCNGSDKMLVCSGGSVANQTCTSCSSSVNSAMNYEATCQ